MNEKEKFSFQNLPNKFQVDKLREIMRTSLESDSPQNCINAVEHYLANLYGMVKAQERLPPEAAKFIRKNKKKNNKNNLDLC